MRLDVAKAFHRSRRLGGGSGLPSSLTFGSRRALRRATRRGLMTSGIKKMTYVRAKVSILSTTVVVYGVAVVIVRG